MKSKLDFALDEVLNRLEAGESLEECLAGYPPAQAAELRSLIELRQALAALRQAAPPSPAGMAAQRQRFLEQAARYRREQAQKQENSSVWTQWRLWLGRTHWREALVAATLTLVLSLGALVGVLRQGFWLRPTQEPPAATLIAEAPATATPPSAATLIAGAPATATPTPPAPTATPPLLPTPPAHESPTPPARPTEAPLLTQTPMPQATLPPPTAVPSPLMPTATPVPPTPTKPRPTAIPTVAPTPTPLPPAPTPTEKPERPSPAPTATPTSPTPTRGATLIAPTATATKKPTVAPTMTMARMPGPTVVLTPIAVTPTPTSSPPPR